MFPGNFRLVFFVIILIIGLGVLLSRLFTLTVIEGEYYGNLSSENRIRETKIVAPRGIIYDTEGEPLTRNIPVFKTESGKIYLEHKPDELEEALVKSITREYLLKEAAVHVVGFIGEVSQEELENYLKEENKRYKPADLVGKMGVEKTYDWNLRGVDGKELVEVDASGRVIRVLGKVDAKPGNNLHLSIIGRLQVVAEKALKDKKGAVVASRPDTGEILLLYSSPGFDPNLFIKGEGVGKLLSDQDQPMFNRAIAGLYPPGSTFKIVTAVAALESGTIDSQTKYEDVGILQVGSYSYANWYFTQYGRREGMVDIVKAIKRSNDIFFYKVGEKIGIDKLSLWAKKLGTGQILGIDIEGEEQGIMPDPSWRREVLGQDWFLGNTYHVAIGQGDLETTPLQVNAWTNTIANGGKICRPQIARITKENCQDLGIKEETIKLVKQGMKQACEPGGTGWPLFKWKVESEKLKVDGVDFLETYESTTSAKPIVQVATACKTGTSEYGDPEGKTHAWFTIFAPVEKPEISVTVLVESGGEGSSVAAPIAKEILEEWFKN